MRARRSIEKGHDVSCSIDALEKQGVVPWEGVVRPPAIVIAVWCGSCMPVLTAQRNPEARNYMKDQMSMGDLALFYHSNCKVPGVVGIARVASAPYADPSQFDKTSPYYDARSTAESPRWMLVDFAFERRLGRLVSLHEIRATRELADMVLLRRMRLSVQPVDADAFDVIVRLGDTPASP